MSQNAQGKPPSPVNHGRDSKSPSDKENKENAKSSIIRRPEKSSSSGASGEVDEKIRKMYEPTGCIPKRFGNVNRSNAAPNHQNILQGRAQGNSEVFSKSNFSIFDEDADERLSKETEEWKKLNRKVLASSSMLDGQLPMTTIKETFTRPKEFFVRQESVAKEDVDEGKAKRGFRRLQRIQPIDEASKSPGLVVPSERVKQIIQEHFEPSKVTPHDVPPPSPKRIKVLHKSIQDHEEEEEKRRMLEAERKDTMQMLYPEEFMLFEEEKDKFQQFIPNYRELNASVDQRQTVVNFLLHVSSHNCLPSNMVYPVVRIFDDMLQACRIPLQNLQLIMICALWIIMKKDYIAYRIPGAQKMASFSNGLYTDADVRSGEIQIMQTLKFQINYPDLSSMLVYFMLALDYSDFIDEEQRETIYYFGGYMLDLVLFDEELMKTSPILLSAAAAELAITLVMEPENTLHCTFFKRWRSGYANEKLQDEDINHCRILMIRNIIESCYRSSKSHVVHKKYNKSRFGRVSKKLIDKIQKLVPPII
ncbi:G2/mitotic-specific cyclin CYB1 [Diachasma alloeum]|uniref:G2/mitotic-specific cyclin CYB1 n=1 Tax=Diachasma alloeum TaxID=454923 RepID=UPI000738160C|nr:G2/mitotic-specific cyclin CYB1 [Diachasma alloeum]